MFLLLSFISNMARILIGMGFQYQYERSSVNIVIFVVAKTLIALNICLNYMPHYRFVVSPHNYSSL